MRELLSGTEVDEVDGGPGRSGRKSWVKACKEGGGGSRGVHAGSAGRVKACTEGEVVEERPPAPHLPVDDSLGCRVRVRVRI